MTTIGEQLYEPEGTPDDFQACEERYQEHIRHEGDGQANDHPDGCYFCGSGLHHSGDCPERY